MITRKITEIVEEFDDDGNLIKRTTTSTEENDDTVYPTYPIYPNPITQPYTTWCSNTRSDDTNV